MFVNTCVILGATTKMQRITATVYMRIVTYPGLCSSLPLESPRCPCPPCDARSGSPSSPGLCSRMIRSCRASCLSGSLSSLIALRRIDTERLPDLDEIVEFTDRFEKLDALELMDSLVSIRCSALRGYRTKWWLIRLEDLECSKSLRELIDLVDSPVPVRFNAPGCGVEKEPARLWDEDGVECGLDLVDSIEPLVPARLDTREGSPIESDRLGGVDDLDGVSDLTELIEALVSVRFNALGVF